MGSTFTNLLYHIIFSTKNRLPLINQSFCKELYRYIAGIIRAEGGTVIAIGGMPDHVHLVVNFKPNISISEMLRRIKGNSSKWMREKGFGELPIQWQDGYGAFSVSESQLAVVKEYVKTQEEHHRKKTFQEEFLEFLEKQKIDYDERYIWN